MNRLNVNPTRMELTGLKKRLKVARRGHKLLKDKRDELMKQFLERIRLTVELRRRTEEMIAAAQKNFLAARAVMSREVLDEALMFPSQTAEVTVGSRNVMSVEIPELSFRLISAGAAAPADGTAGDAASRVSLPYGFAGTSSDLDESIIMMAEVLPLMLELAEAEKTAQLLAREIERTRRRVNALEYIMLPRLDEIIKYITMKLEENERGNLTRLMKVKSMMLEQVRREHLAAAGGDDDR